MRFSLITFDEQANVVKQTYPSERAMLDCPVFKDTSRSDVPYLVGTLPLNQKYTRFDIRRQINQELAIEYNRYKAIAVHKVGEWCKQQSMLYKLYLLNKGQ